MSTGQLAAEIHRETAVGAQIGNVGHNLRTQLRVVGTRAGVLDLHRETIGVILVQHDAVHTIERGVGLEVAVRVGLHNAGLHQLDHTRSRLPSRAR